MDDGPLREFAEDLRQLRSAAGTPTYRELSRKAQYSTSALAAATSGQSLPTLEVTLAYVRACGGNEQEWRERWTSVSQMLRAQPESPAGAAASAPETPGQSPNGAPGSHSPAPRSLVKIGLAPLIIILAIVTVFALNQHGHSPAQLATQPPTTEQLASPDTPDSNSPDSANPPAATPTTSNSAAAGLSYDETAGVGCPGASSTSTFQDQPHPTTHPLSAATATTWSVQECQNALLTTTPTTNAKADAWQNDYGWNFHNVPTSAACTFHIYIADSPNSQYHADYYWTTGNDQPLDSQHFQLDQSALRGTWVTHGPFTFPTGQAELEMTDSRTNGSNAPMTISVARLTCT